MTATATIEAPPPFAALRNAGPVSLFVDFDGTLVDIAPSPEAIVVPPGLPQRLLQLSEQLDGRLALVSGRSLENIAHHLGAGLPVAQAGSHGLERIGADGAPLGGHIPAFPDAVRVAVAQYAASARGLHYESKRYGVALHYRAAPEREAACRAFADELAALYALKVKRGQCVVELTPVEADKGAAVCALMRQPPFAGSLPVFLGDDVTDEDGFRAVAELGGFGIVVGRNGETLATYRLATPAKVYEWLDL
jgi:trehalose 6-phosphate phosphatase